MGEEGEGEKNRWGARDGRRDEGKGRRWEVGGDLKFITNLIISFVAN